MGGLSGKKEKLQKIKKGKGVQHILDEAYKILGNPLLAHDMEYKLFAHNKDAVNDDPIWNEFVTTGTVDLNRLIFYKEESFFDMAANAEKATFLPSDKLEYDRLFGKLFVKNNIQVGCVVLLASETPFDGDDAELFEVLCDILNNELGNDEFFRQYGQTYMETLIGELIDKGIEDKRLVTAHIESLYIGLKTNLFLIVADIGKCSPAHSGPAYFRDLFKKARPDFKYTVYSDYVLILMSSENKAFDVKNDLKGLHRLFEKHNIYAGLSGRFENLFELSKHYGEALHALQDGLAGGREQRLFVCDGDCRR